MIPSWNQFAILSPALLILFPNGVRIFSFVKSNALPKTPPLRTLWILPSLSFSSVSSPKKNLLKVSALAIPIIPPSAVKMGPPGSNDRPGIIPSPLIRFQAVPPANAPVIVEGAYFLIAPLVFSRKSLEINPDFGSSILPKISSLTLSEAPSIPPTAPITLPAIVPKPKGKIPRPPAMPPRRAPAPILGAYCLKPSYTFCESIPPGRRFTFLVIVFPVFLSI